MDESRSTESEPPSEGAPLIVVIDDHELVRGAMVAVLAAFGGSAEAFDSLSAAESAMRGRGVGLVFLDWHMPDIDGAGAVERVERAWPEARVVLVSGDTASIPHEIQERVTATLRKPLAPERLKELLSDPAR